MNQEQREYTLIAVGYNCILLVLALAALSVSGWLLLSGRLFSEGIDATFLFVVGLVLAFIFSICPAMALRAGLLRDVRELLKSAGEHAVDARPQQEKAWRESHVH
jgi:hypothetical protein